MKEKHVKCHMNLFHKEILPSNSIWVWDLSFFVQAQEIVPEEVKGKVQIQVKAGIWLDKKKQSTT